jgi:two-component system, sporulation sensor kinase C
VPTRYDHLRQTRLPRAEVGGTPIDDTSFRLVADYTYDWESWHAPDGGLIWVNFAVERLTGYRPAECFAMSDYPLPILVERDRERMREMFDEARSGLSRNDVEFQVRHRSGEIRSMAISWQPMYDAAHTHLGFRTSVRDITERCLLREQNRRYAEHLEQLVQERTARIAHLEQQRRQMEKLAALGHFAARVAHEVNNPLAGIRNAFELIKGDLTPEHEHYHLFELIDGEIERISAIVHQMYQLYRPQRSQVREFSIGRTVSEVVLLLEGVARKRKIHLLTEIPDSLPLSRLSDGEVKQILYNLINNAIQASPPGESVLIRLEAEQNAIRVHVIDRGSGIDENVLPSIFDPFFTTKQDEERAGMGLGLSVSRSLIEAMGGEIEVETALGEGSRFSARFPLDFEPDTVESS